MPHSPEVAVNPAGSAVEFRMAGGTFYLDAACARMFVVSLNAAIERVERIQAELRTAAATR